MSEAATERPRAIASISGMPKPSAQRGLGGAVRQLPERLELGVGHVVDEADAAFDLELRRERS